MEEEELSVDSGGNISISITFALPWVKRNRGDKILVICRGAISSVFNFLSFGG